MILMICNCQMMNNELEEKIERDERERMRLEMDINRLQQVIGERDQVIDGYEHGSDERIQRLTEQVALHEVENTRLNQELIGRNRV